MAQGSNQVWVWSAVNQDKAFRHPADVPLEDEAAAKACFLEGLRGPRIARVSPATLLESKGDVVLIAEQGATREIARHMVLPWYEGLLLLEELEAVKGKEGHIQASWCNDETRALLDKERSKSLSGRLNGTLYAEKRLLKSCLTGSRFVDADGKEFKYRRENIKVDDQLSLAEGDDKDGLFRITDVKGYMPPWEAFCHEKAGFYQDFYQVQWGYPFSEIDYSIVENGCVNSTGSTWEPDENLSSHLDSMRIVAKRGWIKRRREMELTMGSAASPVAATIKKEKEEGPPVKMARLKRDGEPLEQDLLRSKVGHDFAPDAIELALGQIRSGWPKRPEDYPKGFAVASPPGFCWAACDCMDDQRPQRPWETTKQWLEDPTRSSAAQSAINAFSEQTRFVRKRGQVSKMCFFETAQGAQDDQTKASAALELGHSAERALLAVLQEIPIASLLAEADPIRIPGRAHLSDDKDYLPLRFAATLASGVVLPQWCNVDPDDGRIAAMKQPNLAELPVKIDVDLFHAEGSRAKAAFTVVPERYPPSQAPWVVQTGPIALRFNDPSKCPLERGVRAALLEHFAEVFDFNRRVARERPLGIWLETMLKILCLLRTAAGTNLALAQSQA